MAEPSDVLERARLAGVAPIVCVGTEVATSRQALDLATQDPDVMATVGLHPHEASRFEDERGALDALATRDDVAGIGETGFDLHYLHSPLEAQERAFRHQIALAAELDRPLVIHSRDAWADTFRVLESEPTPPRLVFHCFTGGPEEARRALDLGAHLSFSGIATFPNAEEVRAAATSVPLEMILLETDAPYLAPVPHRGRTNEPALLPHVGRAIAGALDCSPEELARCTSANTKRFFARP